MREVTTDAVLDVWLESQTFTEPREMYEAEDAFFLWLAQAGMPRA